MTDFSRHREKARRFAWLAGVAVAHWILLPCAAQSAANTRIFRSSDGLKDSSVSAISLSPRGNLWLKHPEAEEITVFDGYSFHTLPSPGKNNFRVYENRSGQLWSLDPQGLLVYDGTQWVLHTVKEIRDEFDKNPLRHVRQIALIPAERDHIFFLLSDKLMEYDASARRATVVRRAAETRLGKFFEMTETRDTNVWVSGERGLARVPGPIRRVNAGTPWQEFPVGEALPVENLQRPFEDARGGIVALAFTTTSPAKRVIVRFDGTHWTQLPTPAETLREAWPGWDQIIWGYTFNSLFRFDLRQPGRISREGSSGQFRDALTETNGAFWLAASEELARYAPNLWRTPAEEIESPIHALLEDAAGRLWCASTEGMVMFDDDPRTPVRWPESAELSFTATDRLVALADGRIAISAGENPLLFEPRTGLFRAIIHPDGRRVRLLGQAKEGRLYFQTRPKDSASGGEPQIEEFDGERFRLWPHTLPAEPRLREIYFCFTAQNGDVWFGGNGGLVLARDGQMQTFGAAEGFRDDQAFCLLEAGDGKLWCGGLYSIQEFNGKAWSYVRTGLDRVSSLTKTRDGKIWAATRRGLYSHLNGSWVTHGPEEGLGSTVVSDIREDRQSRLWAATTRGLSLFHADADTGPPRTLPPVLASGQTPSTEESITVLFHGVDKWHNTPADRLLFSHRLDEGLWSPFVPAGSKTFERLGSGEHRIEVRAMDRNWNEDRSPQRLEFMVMLPWYREPRLLAVVLAGLAMVLFFAGVAVNQHRRLIRSYAEVENIVAIRTRELGRANEELLHSQKMTALGTLAAGIAHDFNNILSIIKGSAQIIERNLEDKDKIRTRLSRIKTVVEQGSGIVKSMLGLSRVTDRDVAPCDIAELIREAIKLLSDRLPSEVTIRFEATGLLPPVETVKELTQQMLYNLVLNAVDAMSGAGEVVLRGETLTVLPQNLVLAPAPASRYVAVSVIDSGTGIAPEVLPRIFEPFFTTKALSSRRGTGLGLSMVYELAKEMGYGLQVQSTPGQGATFTIILPVREQGLGASPVP